MDLCSLNSYASHFDVSTTELKATAAYLQSKHIALGICLEKTYTKRRNIIVGFAIIVVFVVLSVGALIFYQQLTPTSSADSITVSGKASSASLSQPFSTSIQRIDFADTQTGTVTTFLFSFTQQSNNPTGNYFVYLKNEHSYNVFISYYHGISPNMKSESDYFTTFTVNATAGEKAVTKNFT